MQNNELKLLVNEKDPEKLAHLSPLTQREILLLNLIGEDPLIGFPDNTPNTVIEENNSRKSQEGETNPPQEEEPWSGQSGVHNVSASGDDGDGSSESNYSYDSDVGAGSYLSNGSYIDDFLDESMEEKNTSQLNQAYVGDGSGRP